MKDLKIKPVLNGFIVDVGCQKLVFGSLADMTKALKEYYGAKKPSEVEKKWLNESLNSGKNESVAVIGIGSEVTYTLPSSG